MENIKYSSGEINAIEKQKTRALQYLKASQENFDGITHISADDVTKKLSQGLVPPIFHTLCRNETDRLFLPNTPVSLEEGEVNVIELSSKAVKAGVAESDSMGKISSFEDESYLKAFFQTDETAYSTVKDSVLSSEWMFSDQGTATITSLINLPATMVGEDIEVTNLISTLGIDKTVEDHSN